MYLDLLPSLRCRNHNAVQFPENIVHNTTSDFKIFPGVSQALPGFVHQPAEDHIIYF